MIISEIGLGKQDLYSPIFAQNIDNSSTMKISTEGFLFTNLRVTESYYLTLGCLCSTLPKGESEGGRESHLVGGGHKFPYIV